MNLSDLNQNQYEAVTSSEQYIRVVAGAGAGKTRVLTQRIASLIMEKNILPYRILGITFTNKAAKEIQERIVNMLGDGYKSDLSTIHSWCARFLRRNSEYIAYPRSFTILDDEDQKSIFKEIFVSKNRLKNDSELPKAMSWIGTQKMKGYQYKDLEHESFLYPNERLYMEIFKEYDRILKERTSLDFDDLMLKTIQILEENPLIQEKYCKFYQHILVDEFQDINDVQFRLITLLMNPSTNLYVVGDPDQTIYTWRGANNKIIIELEKNLQNIVNKNAKVQTIILNQNYRSTSKILDAANSLISFNKDRVAKDLFSTKDEGESISVNTFRTAKEEASDIATSILELQKNNKVDLKNIAILYRANYLTRELETQLNMYRIKYRIFGGQKFFQRREIKDILAYLSLIVNPTDDTAFLRVINVPKRGIGQVSLSKIEEAAYNSGQTKYLYLKENLANVNLPAKSFASLKKMFSELSSLEDRLVEQEEKGYYTALNDFVEGIGYFHYLKEEDDNTDERIENVRELLASIANFLVTSEEKTLTAFIENAILQSGQDEINDGNYISLLTVHTAKGLEYEYVFLYGFGDGVFPSQRAILESKEGIEEERRLAYVAFTRAKKKLYISSNQDYNFTLGTSTKPSRFIKESGLTYKNIDEMYFASRSRQFEKFPLKPSLSGPKQTAPSVAQTNGITDWKVGDIVDHKAYGRGIVLEVKDKLLVVKFDNEAFGTKNMLANHPTLSRV